MIRSPGAPYPLAALLLSGSLLAAGACHSPLWAEEDQAQRRLLQLREEIQAMERRAASAGDRERGLTDEVHRLDRLASLRRTSLAWAWSRFPSLGRCAAAERAKCRLSRRSSSMSFRLARSRRSIGGLFRWLP